MTAENVTPMNNAAPPPPTIDLRTIKLTRPIEGHKGRITSITLSEPGAELMLKHGVPWRQIVEPGGALNGGNRFEMEYIPEKMAIYAEAMSGIDSMTLGTMTARDMNTVFLAIVNMLQPAGN